jgi:undecaprenyl-diphosphatase
MSYIEAIILGIIQGLTEFLPVSSSGHIVLGEAILNTQSHDNLAFTVVVHFATVISTIVVFRKDIFQIIRELLDFKWNKSTQFVLYILISMIPVMIAGLLFKDEVEALFEGKVMLVGFMLILTGLILLSTLLAGKKQKDLNTGNAFVIGIAQAIAVIPGISRSGSTISTALLFGIDREKAARFSFLMVIPPIIGIMLLDTLDMFEQQAAGELSIQPLVLTVGFIAAFLTGLIACKWMIRIMKMGKIQYFAYYCFLVGIIAILWSWIY